jgi:Ca2+-binding RTX toxin-like protein
MNAKIFTGKTNQEEDFILTLKSFTGAYVLRNFSADDNVTIDMSLVKKSSFVSIYTEVERISDDLLFTLKDTRSGKIKSSFALEDVYAEDGLKYLTTMTPWSVDVDALHLDLDYAQYLIVGTSSNDNLSGTSRDDVIYGNAGNDSISGGDGDDTFYFGSGDDTISGGPGADNFKLFGVPELSNKNVVYEKTITDFQENIDEIDIGSLVVAFKLKLRLSESLQSWKKGSVIFETDGTDGWIYGNFDSDKTPEMKIKLLGITVLNDDDGFFKQGI